MSTKKLKLTPKTTEVAEPQNSIIKFLKVDTNKKDNKICEQIMSKPDDINLSKRKRDDNINVFDTNQVNFAATIPETEFLNLSICQENEAVNPVIENDEIQNIENNVINDLGEENKENFPKPEILKKKEGNDISTYKIIPPEDLIKMKEFKSVFIIDINEKTRKVFCEVCSKSISSRRKECLDHIKSQYHEKKSKEKTNHVDKYMNGREVARIEIIFAFMTAVKNLSFSYSDTYGKYISHMFEDSISAKKVVLNRHKTKEIIELVLVSAVDLSRMPGIRKLTSIMIDSSRDIQNKNELILAVQYFDDSSKSIKKIVFEILEQNDTKSKQILDSLIEVFKVSQIHFKNVLAVMTDNAADMVGRENGLTELLKQHDNGIFTTTCICHGLSLVIVNSIKSFRTQSKQESNELIISNDINYEEKSENDNNDEEKSENDNNDEEKSENENNEEDKEDSSFSETQNNLETFDVGEFINSIAR